MAQINLLPWREQARQKQKQRFYIIIGFFVFLTLIIAAIIHFFFSALISTQIARNNFLQTEISQNQTAFTQLKKVEDTQKNTINKIQFLSNIQINNFKIVQLLTELPQLTPNNIIFLKIASDNLSNVVIEGKSQTSFDITTLVRNLSQSKILDQPQLGKITAQEDDPEKKTFELRANIR